jgi:hypothetical protein
MKVNKISPAEKGIFNTYMRAPVYLPEPRQEDESSQDFRQMLQQKKQDFSQGKIPYQRILRAEGWIYRIG